MFLNEIYEFKQLFENGNVTLNYYVSQKKYFRNKLEFLISTHLYNIKRLLYFNKISSYDFNIYTNKILKTKEFYQYILSSF